MRLTAPNGIVPPIQGRRPNSIRFSMQSDRQLRIMNIAPADAAFRKRGRAMIAALIRGSSPTLPRAARDALRSPRGNMGGAAHALDAIPTLDVR